MKNQGEVKNDSAQTLANVQSGREVSGFQFMKESMQRTRVGAQLPCAGTWPRRGHRF